MERYYYVVAGGAFIGFSELGALFNGLRISATGAAGLAGKNLPKFDLQLFANKGAEKLTQLTKMSDSQIKKLGGESFTAELKAMSGKSKANLYIDKEGNVFSNVRGSSHFEFLRNIKK